MLYETFAPLATSDGDSKQGLSVTDATDQAQAITEAIQKMEDTISTLDPVRKAITTEQAVALQNATVSKQLFDAAQGAEQAGVACERAKQLEASGEHIAQMQERVLQRNRQALGGMNADIMTAKRVATINQQNTVYANNVTDYLQTSILFLCVAIVIMFGFGMGMSLLKGVMAHPVVLMQALLILLATVYIIVMLYEVITNWNHYRMLYQERVFPLYRLRTRCRPKSASARRPRSWLWTRWTRNPRTRARTMQSKPTPRWSPWTPSLRPHQTRLKRLQ